MSEEDISKYDETTKTVLEASATERFLGKYFAPFVLSNIGRIVFLVIYAFLIAMAIYGATQVRVHFEIGFFIGDDSEISAYYSAKDKYFPAAGSERTMIYIESDEIEWSTEANQLKLI